MVTKFDFTKERNLSTLDNLRVKSVPDVQAFHQTTHIELSNKMSSSCKVVANDFTESVQKPHRVNEL